MNKPPSYWVPKNFRTPFCCSWRPGWSIWSRGRTTTSNATWESQSGLRASEKRMPAGEQGLVIYFFSLFFGGILNKSSSHVCWRWDIPNSWVMWKIATFGSKRVGKAQENHPQRKEAGTVYGIVETEKISRLHNFCSNCLEYILFESIWIYLTEINIS